MIIFTKIIKTPLFPLINQKFWTIFEIFPFLKDFYITSHTVGHHSSATAFVLKLDHQSSATESSAIESSATESLATDSEIEIAVQINGKLRGTILIEKNLDKDSVCPTGLLHL